jgi:hypothetical protein
MRESHFDFSEKDEKEIIDKMIQSKIEEIDTKSV